MRARKRGRIPRMSELRGKLRQKIPGGPYYYRLRVANNVRREFSLKTCVFEEAVQKAADLDVIWSAPTQEVAIAQINALKGYSQESKNLPFDEAWRLYEVHPDRAMPHTVSEQNAYRSTFDEFVQFVSKPFPGRKKHTIAGGIAEVSPQVCEEFSSYLKTTSLAVDTHNRKIKRLRKIFDCLTEYYAGENPFRSKALLRSEREERGTVVHRQAFTKEQEEQLIAVLSDDDPKHKIMNKDEIRVLYVIGRFTGQRLKDCVLLQWQNIDMSNRRLWVKQFKTGKEVTIPMAPELYTALTEARKWRTDQYVTPKTAARYNKTNAEGKNVGNNLVNLDVLRVIRWIGLEPSVDVPGRKKKMTVYGFHSLRHSFASFCAEAGVPKAVLLSILGTDSEIADKYYTHVGDESQRKAVEAIRSRSGEKSAQAKIDEVLTLLDSNPKPTKKLLNTITTILRQEHEIQP